MSCDHKLIAEHVSDYIENNLPPYLRRQCDEALQQCQHCQETVQKAQAIYHLAQDWEDLPVPEWSRARHVLRPAVRQINWPNWAALACSMLAVVLVVFQLEIRVDQGLHISFGGTQSEARLQQLLAQEIEAYEARQDLALEARFDQYTELQDINNQLLLAEWTERNREERQDDLNFLMSGWQNQRQQDRQLINQQLSSLAENQIDSNEYLNELMLTVGLPQGGNL